MGAKLNPALVLAKKAHQVPYHDNLPATAKMAASHGGPVSARYIEA